METLTAARVLVAERLEDGLVIKFLDGTCAFYSAALLYTMLPQAEELDETKVDW